MPHPNSRGTSWHLDMPLTKMPQHSKARLYLPEDSHSLLLPIHKTNMLIITDLVQDNMPTPSMLPLQMPSLNTCNAAGPGRNRGQRQPVGQAAPGGQWASDEVQVADSSGGGGWEDDSLAANSGATSRAQKPQLGSRTRRTGPSQRGLATAFANAARQQDLSSEAADGGQVGADEAPRTASVASAHSLNAGAQDFQPPAGSPTPQVQPCAPQLPAWQLTIGPTHMLNCGPSALMVHRTFKMSMLVSVLSFAADAAIIPCCRCPSRTIGSS